MSHTVTVTRTTTTTTSAIIVNTGYLKTVPGLLKLAQLVINIVNVCIMTLHFGPRSGDYHYYSREQFFFFVIAITFLIGTAIILLACLLSIPTASILPKTIYEYFYHGFAFLLYLTASLTLIVYANQKGRNRNDDYFLAVSSFTKLSAPRILMVAAQ